ILFNLLHNSLQAVAKDGPQVVRITAAAADGGWEFVVSDTGRGVSPADVDRIFEPFFTTRTLGEGTGLGLSIARGLAEAHGGRLYLRRPAQPTEFVLWLPADATLLTGAA